MLIVTSRRKSPSTVNFWTCSRSLSMSASERSLIFAEPLMPAAVQISAANTVTLSDSRFVNLGQTAIGIGNDANAHASGVGLGTSNITVTRSEIARNSAGGIVVGGVRADAHHPGDQRMVNRNAARH